MLQDELNASAIHQRDITAEHFSPGDVVHVMATVLEARQGHPFFTYKITGRMGSHATGEPAHVLESDSNTVRAPARYLMHRTGCTECAAFEGALREEITSADYGETDPREVMLMARSADGQLLHILDALRLEESERD
ncbi:hypothetical protein [Streptomyces rubradiris]|uniref:Uncharacterized protein n=1 Tax=Streptomyces rubradiris TaxID=285531 RepID=A0ABQ3RAD1_STRRR|nr:hypothetical protein [Streptomyces rubradiris]GHH26070.1 hypothetical protein GCM10018792_66080 [Streptomyces rubradiris]GHI52813.1 hypothetical protein Srubr_26590 [Streptomyces rubradiris]